MAAAPHGFSGDYCTDFHVRHVSLAGRGAAGGVVLCIILFSTPAHHIDYAIHRMIDTGVGVVIALLLNYLLPRSRLERWLHLDLLKKRNQP